MNIKSLIKSEALKTKPSKRKLSSDSKSEKILIELSNDTDQKIRNRVAANMNCPEEVLVRLSSDSVVNVRYNVACNPNTPMQTLKHLCDDEAHVVSSSSYYTIECKTSLSKIKECTFLNAHFEAIILGIKFIDNVDAYHLEREFYRIISQRNECMREKALAELRNKMLECASLWLVPRWFKAFKECY